MINLKDAGLLDQLLDLVKSNQVKIPEGVYRELLISNDVSIHGACMLEGVICRRWEEIGRLLLKPRQDSLPGFHSL